jgi:uncharacterized protein YjbI with pentapeptide repeats
MCDPEHLQILRSGVQVWNEWRKTSSEIPDLQMADIAALTLDNINFEQADLSYCQLGSTSLKGANLRKANLAHADLDYALSEGSMTSRYLHAMPRRVVLTGQHV